MRKSLQTESCGFSDSRCEKGTFMGFRKKISFVIPCYNSSRTIDAVLDEIISVVKDKENVYDYEIVAVNDCSPDNVIERLYARADQNTRIKVINLAVNVGKHSAVLEAYRRVTGDYVVNVDDDGQIPLDRLWDLIEPLEQGHDMAMARYARKKENGIKRFGSGLNHKMTQILLEKPKDLVFSNFIARQNYICKAMGEYTNVFPYLEGLSLRTTRDIVMVPMEERARTAGESNYTFKKSLALWANGLTAFSVKPLRIGMIVGGMLAAAGSFGILLALILAIVFSVSVTGAVYVILTLLICTGLVLLQLGIAGEYIGRTYIAVNHYKQTVVKETRNL